MSPLKSCSWKCIITQCSTWQKAIMTDTNTRRQNTAKNMNRQRRLLWIILICVIINVLFAMFFQEYLDKHMLVKTSSIWSLTSINLEDQRRKKTFSQGNHLPFPHDHRKEYSSLYSFNRDLAEMALTTYGRDIIFQPLRAYVEGPLNDTVPGTVDTGNLDERRPKIEVGRPGKWYVPLPLRKGTPDDLRMFEYGHKLQSCNDLPAKLPVDRGLAQHIVPNVNNRRTFSSGEIDVWEEAKEGCPVNADPFLPWVHDIFPDRTGSMIHFVAQNKRRCNSGKAHIDDILALQPQVTILQPISVKRIDEVTAHQLGPDLWRPSNRKSNITRYRLASHEEADPDAMFTRFICRFRAIDYTQSPPTLINVGETLSRYEYNYEFVNYRKEIGDLSMLTPKGKDNPMFWLAQMRFDCPVPENGDLRSVIATGEGVLSDGTPSVYVDVVPIRTAPRYGKGMSFFTPDMAGDTLEVSSDNLKFSNLMKDNIVFTDKMKNSDLSKSHRDLSMKNGFDPWLFWGDGHVVPHIEASGRWENFPICLHPCAGCKQTFEKEKNILRKVQSEEASIDESDSTVVKKYKLIACLWASASFTTRGNAETVSNTASRLIEWIEFHLLVGFDHIYVYDNTGAHTHTTSLKSTLFPRFLESEVTRIDWPSRVCNNNIPAHENTGERSSQYAAESSCRARYGPYTEWMASFDTDEYLIPMGKYNSMVEVVDDVRNSTQILTFRSTRASPLHALMEPFYDHYLCGTKSNPTCLSMREGPLFVEAYNCDFEKSPKPDWADRAKKQLFRPEYVLTHYVHYATVTRGLLQTKEEANITDQPWRPSFSEKREADLITDEINQAVMLHAKTAVPEYTTGWKERCKVGAKNRHGENCRVGFPWPENEVSGESANPDGYGYNCFVNEKLNKVWIPKLRVAMEKRNVRMTNLSPDYLKSSEQVSSPKELSELDHFCGWCKWKGTKFTCNERVAYVMQKKKKSERDARAEISIDCPLP